MYFDDPIDTAPYLLHVERSRSAQHLVQRPGLQRARFGIDDDIAAEDHQRRCRTDIKLRADRLLILGIDLHEQDIGIPARGGGKDRRERATRRARWRPEIDDCKWMAVDRRCEILFGEFDNARGVGRHLAGCQTSLIFLRLKGAGASSRARYPPSCCRGRWYRRLRD